MRAPASPAPRVLFVTHNVPRHPGDVAGSFVLRLAVALQAAGARVDVIAPGAAGLAPQDTIEGVRITRVRYASDARMTLAYTGTMAEAVRGSWSGRLALLQLLRALRRAARQAIGMARRAGDPYTHVHAHWWFPAGLALWRAIPPALPVVITMHGSDVRLAERTRPAHGVMRAVLAGATVRTAVSSWLADTAQRIAAGPPILVAPMPVDDRLFLAAPVSDAGAVAPRDGVLFVGRLNAQKGLADLLDAMADPRLAETPLHVIGDGPDRDALEQRAVARGLARRVRWHGARAQPDLASWYRQAAVIVIPSRQEGLGLVAVEAQLCGTPVVAYAEGGLLDVVRPEHGGTLVTPGETGALADAVHRVVSNPALASQLGARARTFVESGFTPAAVAARYLAIYAEASARVSAATAAAGP